MVDHGQHKPLGVAPSYVVGEREDVTVPSGKNRPVDKPALDLSKPMGIRAEMARAGIAPMQTQPYEDPEFGWTDPLNDDEMRTIMRRFFGALWRACERAETDAKRWPRNEVVTVGEPVTDPVAWEPEAFVAGWRCEECGAEWIQQTQCRRCGNRTRVRVGNGSEEPSQFGSRGSEDAR